MLKRVRAWRALIVVSCALLLPLLGQTASAAQLSTASLSLTDSRAGAPFTGYVFTASNVTLTSIKCIKVSFNTAADGSGNKPVMMSVGGANFSTFSDYVPTPAAWSTVNDDAAGIVRATNASGEVPASSSSRLLRISNVNNDTTPGTYYALINTYNNTDCSTSPVDNAVVPFALTDGNVVSAIVSPTLSFTVSGHGGACNGISPTLGSSSSGSGLSLGHISAGRYGIAAQDLSVSTNATSGFTVYARYTDQLKDGAGHAIPDVTANDWSNATPFPNLGTAGFGVMADWYTPDTWVRMSTTNTDNWMSSSGPTLSNTTCLAYRAQAAATTPAGNYGTTVIYTAVSLF